MTYVNQKMEYKERTLEKLVEMIKEIEPHKIDNIRVERILYSGVNKIIAEVMYYD